MLQLYVLIEPQGALIFPNVPVPQELGEMLLVHSPATGERIGIFFSRLDAEICLQYLNQQTFDGERNHYECRPVSDPAVQRMLRYYKRYGITCVSGFMTSSAGRLVISQNLYSLAQMALHADDETWLRRESAQPDRSFLHSAQVHFEAMGASDHLKDCASLVDWDARSIERQAQIAIADIGFTVTGDESGFVVYSPSRKAWRKLSGIV